MVYILTLVNTNGLDAAVEEAAATLLRSQGAEVLKVERFGTSADVTFRLAAPADAHTLCHGLPEGAWQADIAIQPAEFRSKKLLVSDMEMTLVANEFLDDLAEITGVGPQVSAITALAMNGEIDFPTSFRMRLALFEGEPATLLDAVWKKMKWMPGAETLFSGLRANGVRTVIVSGGLKCFGNRVKDLLGADACWANDLEIQDGKLTGRAVEPVAGRELKREVLETEAASLKLPLEATMAVGDGANDLLMLERAGLGIAYHAKPNVASVAKCRVEHSDLTALLAFAGIR